MNVDQSHHAIISLNASYGNRASELDETQLLLWTQTLAEVTVDQWSMFRGSYQRTDQGQRWPPAVVDFQGWWAGERRRLDGIRRAEQPKLTAGPSRIDGAQMIRNIRDGLKQP